jgi:hypothetical protein
MSNGTGQSKAPYIIICAGQTGVRSVDNPSHKITYASECAADFMKHMEITRPGQVSDEDFETVSDLQHAMMNVVASATLAEAEKLCKDMFTLLRGIEDRLRN